MFDGWTERSYAVEQSDLTRGDMMTVGEIHI